MTFLLNINSTSNCCLTSQVQNTVLQIAQQRLNYLSVMKRRMMVTTVFFLLFFLISFSKAFFQTRTCSPPRGRMYDPLACIPSIADFTDLRFIQLLLIPFHNYGAAALAGKCAWRLQMNSLLFWQRMIELLRNKQATTH
jgi:hypothetical protein